MFENEALRVERLPIEDRVTGTIWSIALVQLGEKLQSVSSFK